MSIFNLNRTDTLVLKGIAICAMLCHHLYTGADVIGDIVPYTGIMAIIGNIGKVCVAMFLFCSGYGLSAQYDDSNIKDSIRFVAKRLVKFYANYWVIFLLFVPFTILVFNRPLSVPYGEDANIITSLIKDIFGVACWKSYNITWWFNQLIIVLYCLFPVLYYITRRIPVTFFIISALLMIYGEYIPYNIDADIYTWMFPFVLGILWKLNENKLLKMQEWISDHAYSFATLSMVLFVACLIVRTYYIIPILYGTNMDGFLTCAMVLCLISVLRKANWVMTLFGFLGKHSINIYMMHTFFNAYWHPEWLHTGEWLRGGGNFVLLMIICLLISIGIEFLKEKIRLYELVNIITKRI